MSREVSITSNTTSNTNVKTCIIILLVVGIACIVIWPYAIKLHSFNDEHLRVETQRSFNDERSNDKRLNNQRNINNERFNVENRSQRPNIPFLSIASSQSHRFRKVGLVTSTKVDGIVFELFEKLLSIDSYEYYIRNRDGVIIPIDTSYFQLSNNQLINYIPGYEKSSPFKVTLFTPSPIFIRNL